MKVMMLGGGTNQLYAIKRILDRGDEVLVSDYLENSPGKDLATYTALADTFSYEDTIQKARSHKVDAVLTVGTDQPVLTAARVAETLDLPSPIKSETALHVTNKKHMKAVFKRNNIPTVDYIIIGQGHLQSQGLADRLKKFPYPGVLKPVDSQGQRGIFKVYSDEDVLENINETLKYSKTKEAVLEVYYENQEVTVSGWVENGQTYILTMTDRVTFSEDNKIGVCVSHEHPSVHIEKFGSTAKRLTEQIVDAFEIEKGPIYFQFLVGKDGMLVNEIACRIGGAYEDQFIPKITGFDILDEQLNIVQGKRVNTDVLKAYDFRKNTACLSVQLFFAQAGSISEITDENIVLKMSGVADFRCHYKVGDRVPETENASARAGFCLLYGDNETDIDHKISNFYGQFKIMSQEGDNLLIKGCRGNRK